MNCIKKRISIFLCMLLAFSAVFFAVPQEAKAATNVWLYGPGASTDTKEIQVYRGSKNLYAGDFVEAVSMSGTSYGVLSMNSGVTYKSSKPTVASINSKTGLITTKKNGTTVITVKFKGTTAKFTLRVVSKTNLKKMISNTMLAELSDLEECSKAFFTTAGSVTKITSANRYKIMSAYKSYDYKDERGYTSAYASDEYTYYVYSPEATHAYAVGNAFSKYAEERNPFATTSPRCFQLGSISGKGNTKKITVTLKSKVSAEQIFGGKNILSWDTELTSNKTYSFPIRVQNVKTKYKYYAIATVKQGENKMTIQTMNLKLKKGTKYKLLSYDGHSWLDGTINKNTFTAK